MTAPPSPTRHPRRGLRRGLLALAVAAGLVGLAGAVLIGVALTRRQVIGAQLAVRYLAQHGIPARIRFTRLDARGFVASLSLGPADRPDLEAAEVRGTFAPDPAIGPVPTRLPRLTALSLVGARLRARWDGRRLTFGTLQPLVDQAARAPKGAASPDLDIRDSRLDLATPAGAVSLHGDAKLIAGKLSSAALTLDPATLAQGDLKVEGIGADLRASAAGDALHLHGVARAERLAGQGGIANGLSVSFDATVPTDLAGRVQATAQGQAQSLTARGMAADRAAARLDLAGLWTPSSRTYLGRAGAVVQATRLSDRAAGVDVLAPVLTAQSAALDARLAPKALRAGGPVTLTLRVGASSNAASGLRIASADGEGRGRFGYADGRLSGNVDASLRAQGALAPGRAARLAAALAPFSAKGQPGPLAAALSRVALNAPHVALALDGGDLRIATPRPVDATAGDAGGVSLTVRTPGGIVRHGDGAMTGDLTLAGSGALFPHIDLRLDGLTAKDRTAAAQAALKLQGDVGSVRGLDLAWRGTVRRQGEALSVAAAGCAPLSVRQMRDPSGHDLVDNLRLSLCPDGAAPLATTAAGGVRTAARIEALSAEAPAASVALTGGSARVDFDLSKGALSGAAALQALDLRDLTTPSRFGPLHVSGQATAARGDWAGGLALAPQGHGPLVTGRFGQTADGRGWLQASAPALRFAKGGLQPSDLSPLLARYASDASGPLAAALQLGWARTGLTASRLDLSTPGLDLRTPAGRLTGLAGRLVLQPLAPLSTAGVQRLSAASLQTPLPLTDLSAAVALDPKGFEIVQATARVAGGSIRLDPLSGPLTPGATLSPVVRLHGVQLGQVLDAFNLSRALSVKAAISGVLPLSFGAQGVHFADGWLQADGPGELTLHRQALGGVAATAGPPPAPGAPPPAAPAPNAMQDLAFQALEHLAFTTLTAKVDSRPGGRLGVVLHVVGRHEPPKPPPPPRIGLFDLLRGKAFDKDLPLPKGTPIDLTLDTSLNFDDLLAQYGRLGHGPTAGSAPVHP